MATLSEKIKADNAKREKAKQSSKGLLGGLLNAGNVVNAGLLNPNEYNAPAANRFKDSAFGLLGVVPGVGDAASAAESADLFNRGENFAGGIAALGALPMIPSLAGMVRQGGKAADALSYPRKKIKFDGVDAAEIDINQARELIKQQMTDKNLRYGLRVLPDTAEIGATLQPSYRWVDGDFTGKPLRGTSVAAIRNGDIDSALQNLGMYVEHGKNGFYFGDEVALVAGINPKKGQDFGEWTLQDAKVISKYLKKGAGKHNLIAASGHPTGLLSYADEAAPKKTKGVK